MNEIKRKGYNTTIRVDLIRELKILAAEKDCRVNDLLEEAIFDILSKHGKTPPE
ncbi:ribbon-helix-helix domain-containing protein [Desulfosarcina widdelii]|nr:ribbon-helix-helix domain-containing protein [Desulfosarcina widdelii]